MPGLQGAIVGLAGPGRDGGGVPAGTGAPGAGLPSRGLGWGTAAVDARRVGSPGRTWNPIPVGKSRRGVPRAQPLCPGGGNREEPGRWGRNGGPSRAGESRLNRTCRTCAFVSFLNSLFLMVSVFTLSGISTPLKPGDCR